jgi:hypothetical protein
MLRSNGLCYKQLALTGGYYRAVNFMTRTTEAYESILGYNITLKGITFITSFASVIGPATNPQCQWSTDDGCKWKLQMPLLVSAIAG